MKDQDKTKGQLIEEQGEMRRRISDLEGAKSDQTAANDHFEPGSSIWHSLIANTPLFILVLDKEGRIRFVNHTDSGATPDQIIGKAIYDFSRAEDRDTIRACVQEVFQTGKPGLCEGPGLRLDDQEHWYASHFAPIVEDGKVVAVSVISINVTDRNHAEEALRQSEQRMSLHVQQTPLGVIEWDLDGRVTEWNPVAERVFGYTADEALGRHVAFIVPPTAREHAGRVWNDLIARKGGERSTNENITRDGRLVLCEWYNTPLVDADGSVIGVASLVDDITERKRAEEALRESEERFRQAMEATSDGLWDWNVNSGDVYYSPAYSRILGYEAADFANRKESWTDLLHPDDRAEAIAVNQACIENRIPHFEVEFRMRAKSGEWRWILGRGKAVSRDEAGRAIRMIGTHVDITERKRAEEAIKKANDELEEKVNERTAELTKSNEALAIFQRFAEASGQGFGMADLEGRITYVNPMMCRLIGEDRPEDAIGKHFSTYYLEEGERIRKDEIDPAMQRDERWQGELNIRSRKGKLIPTQHGSFLVRDEHGTPFRLGVVVTDISERKLAAEALERERQSLWRMLQASDHERQIISYEIHDGLAQYLAGAAMQFQVHDSLKENSPDEARKAYETALELVRQSHSEARRLISEVRPPVIDEIGLETAMSHLVHEQRRHGGPKIEFRSEVQFGRLPQILENALYRIVQEALTNACKHSKSKKVTVAMTQEEQDVRLEVQDWGIGFDPESVEKGHFGLEGIRQRVRLLGGRLTIESTPGTGTLIQVVVPILERQAER